MDWKKIGKALLYPKMWIMIALIPVATAFLVFSMVALGTESVPAIISYVLAAYTLTVWCFKIPYLIAFFKTFKNENKYVRIWLENPKLRVNVTLYAALFFNTVFAVFQLCLGIYHGSFWFYSLAGYYVMLAAMRFFLVGYTRANNPGERRLEELKKYCACGWVFLTMNLVLSVIVMFMIRFDRTFTHHEITTIAIAAYTFTALTLAIINVVKFRKYNSPAYSASKAISLAAASVSIITLEATMLTTFGAETTDALTRRILLATSGGAISAFLVVMALYMIVTGNKKIKSLKEGDNFNGE